MSDTPEEMQQALDRVANEARNRPDPFAALAEIALMCLDRAQTASPECADKYFALASGCRRSILEIAQGPNAVFFFQRSKV